MYTYIPHRSVVSVPLFPKAHPISRQIGIGDIKKVLRCSAPLILTCAVMFVGLAIPVLAIVPACFRSTAEVMIGDKRARNFFQNVTSTGEQVTDRARVESEIEIIKSGQIAIAVIRELHLDARPEFSPERPELSGWLPLEAWLGSLNPSTPVDVLEPKKSYAVEAFAKHLSVARVGQS